MNEKQGRTQDSPYPRGYTCDIRKEAPITTGIKANTLGVSFHCRRS
jgi:hypothetical protein